MHIVPKFIPKIYLIHRSGERWAYKDIKEAGTELHRIGFYNTWRQRQRALIGTHFRANREWSVEEFCYIDVSYDYIVRDEFGEIITTNDLDDARERKFSKYQSRRYNISDYANKHFRNGPIPYTRCFRGGRSKSNIKTIQERREVVGLLHDEDIREYTIKIRPNRNANNIPTSWDDCGRSDWNTKNWKKHRKHQYR